MIIKEEKKKSGNTYVPGSYLDIGLDSYDQVVLLHLLSFRSKDKDYVFPKISLIAEKTKLGESRVRKSLKSLEEKNIIKIEKCYIERENGKKRQTSNRYFFQKLPNVQQTVDECAKTMGEHSENTFQGAPDTGQINITNNSSMVITNESGFYAPTQTTYGKYDNVFLTVSEYAKLKEKYPYIDYIIDRLSIYIAKNPNNTKKGDIHYIILDDWASRDQAKYTREVKNKEHEPGFDLDEFFSLAVARGETVACKEM